MWNYGSKLKTSDDIQIVSVLPSSALVSASAGLRWSLISIFPYPQKPTHPPGKVSIEPKKAELSKANYISLISRPQTLISCDESQ